MKLAKTKKRLLTIAATAMMVAMIPSSAFGAVTVTDSAGLSTALAGADNEIIVDGTIEIAADETVTFDITGKTITGTQNTAAGYSVINNKGNLTITGDGTIKSVYTAATGSTAYANNVITNGGTLTIKGGTLINESTTATNQCGYAVDNNSGNGNAVLVVEGGTLKTSGSNYYDGIRQFCNSQTNENSVTIKGGDISSIWIQNPSDGSSGRNTKDVKGSITIEGGKIGAVYLEPSANFEASVTGGDIGSLVYNEEDAANADRNLKGFVTGGNFEKIVEDMIADGHERADNGDIICSHEETSPADKAPTCTEDGVKGAEKCDLCGEIIKEGEVVPATGHKFENGVCSCGEKEAANDNDTTQPTDKPSTENKADGKDATPQTGDSSNMTVPMLAAALALIGLITVFARRKVTE